MEQETVTLIASGYEWHCPECGVYNRMIAHLPVVKCKGCGKEFPADPPEHAYD